MRLNKYLAETGACSRREADQWIETGRVTVNGNRAVLGTQVSEGDVVCVDGAPVRAKPKRVYLALNKPVGIECTTDHSDARTGTSNTSALTPKSLGDNVGISSSVEYARLPKFMMLWGKHTGGSGNPSVTFPFTFGQTPRVILTAYSTGPATNVASSASGSSGGIGGTDGPVGLASLQSVTTSGFSAYVHTERETEDVFFGSSTRNFDWFAIGRL